MKEYIELTVTTTHEGSEIVADILWDYSPDGVAVSDFFDVIKLSETGKTWDYIDDAVLKQDKTVLVKGYVPKSDEKVIPEIEKRLLSVKEIGALDLGSLEFTKREVDGDEWKTIWKEHFKPIPIGRVVIVPEWIKYAPKNDEIVVLIGSNMAFGTGEHETTSSCVEFLEKYVSPKDTVIDVGSGSGILGITASKLGAKEVIMTDIDECAVKASKDNAILNGVTNATVLLKNLLDDNKVKGDVIVCNIMAEVLIFFAPYIGNNLKGKGIIILSGILKDRLEKVKTAYAEQGFNFVEEKIKGEWSALVMEKKS